MWICARISVLSSSQWPCGLIRRSSAARLLRVGVWIPPWAWVPVSCDRCILSSRVYCVGMITGPKESYRVWCVWVWSWSLDNKTVLTQ